MKTDHLCIIPECYVDTNLVRILMQVKAVNHQYGAGQVTRKMETSFVDQFSVGVIDNDEKQSTYAKDCKEIAHSDELILCKHPNTHHYLIKITHIMETFILNCATELKMDYESLGITGGKEGLMSITKDKDSLDNPVLRKILKAVAPSTEMQLLAEVLKYLDEKRYQAKEEELKALFSRYGF